MVDTVITQPEAGTNQVIALSDVSGVVFDFSKDDVQSVNVTDQGDIVLSLNNDSSIVIRGAAQLEGSNVSSLSFSNGQVIDLASLDLPSQGGLQITQPVDGSVASYTLQNGQDYDLGFSPADLASVSNDGNVLILTFSDGGQIEFTNFGAAMDGGFDGEFTIDGNAVSILELAESLRIADAMREELDGDNEELMAEIADDVAGIETASGEQAARLAQIQPAAGGDQGSADGRGGFGFSSDVDDAGLSPVPAIGPIGETFLEFNLPEQRDELGLENDISPVAPLPPSLTTAPALVYEDGSVALTVSTTSGPDPDVFTTITISGFPDTLSERQYHLLSMMSDQC